MESSSIVYTRILKDHMAQFMNKNVTVVGRYKGRLGNKLTLETGDNGFFHFMKISNYFLF